MPDPLKQLPTTLVEEVTVSPERYDGRFIFKNFKALREKREPKLVAGRKVLYIIPLQVYEGEIIERLPGGNLMVRLKDPNAAIQTTGEFLIPLSVE